MLGLVKDIQYDWMTFVMTFIVLCDRLSQIKGWVICTAAHSAILRVALKCQPDQWEIEASYWSALYKVLSRLANC